MPIAQVTVPLTVRQAAGLARTVAAFNASQAEDSQLTDEAFAVIELGFAAKQWELAAPASIPLGDWLQRWTDAERDGAFTLGAQNADIRALWIEMMKHPEVQPDNPDLQAGVPLVCAALEQMGVIAPGQAATRAAAISAF